MSLPRGVQYHSESGKLSSYIHPKYRFNKLGNIKQIDMTLGKCS